MEEERQEPIHRLLDLISEQCNRTLSHQQIDDLTFTMMVDDEARQLFLAEFCDRYARFWGSREEPHGGTEEQGQELFAAVENVFQRFMNDRPEPT